MFPLVNCPALACMIWYFALTSALGSAAVARAEDKPPQLQEVKYRVTGLFGPERIADLRAAFEKLPQIKLVSVDYDYGEVSVQYDPAQVFPGVKPEQIVQRFDEMLGGVSFRTFGIQPRCTIPREQQTFVQIQVVGLDCKGCCLAAYERVHLLPGVQWAAASFRDGRVAPGSRRKPIGKNWRKRSKKEA